METFDRWAAQAERIDAGGLSLAVHDVGEGPVVTFLHGYPSSTLDAIPLIDRLDGVRVVAPDLPGFGASDKPVGHPYSIHGAVDAVETVWDRLAVTSTVVVAHDYSVSLAQELLARQAESPGDRPVEVTGVVWSNGGLYPDLHRPTYGQQLLLDPEHGAEIAAAMDETAFANGIGITWGTRRPMTDGEVHDMWRALEHDGGARQAHALLHYIADRRTYADRWRAAPGGERGAHALRLGRARPGVRRSRGRAAGRAPAVGPAAAPGRRGPLAAAGGPGRAGRRGPRAHRREAIGVTAGGARQ